MMDDREPMLDDDHDILNDETFGGDVDGDYEWDGAPPPEELFNFDQPSGASAREDGGAYAQRTNDQLRMSEMESYLYEDQDGGYMNVEESISRLVLDDEDIENERDMFVKASHKSMMPPQVITRNLNLLTEKDVAAPFFGNSVWAVDPSDVLQRSAGAVQPRPVLTQQSSNRPPPGLGGKPSEEGYICLNSLKNTGDMSRSNHQHLASMAARRAEIQGSYSAAKVTGAEFSTPVAEDNLQNVRAFVDPRLQPGYPPRVLGRGLMRHPPPGATDFPGGHNRPMMPPGMRPPQFGPIPPGMHGFHPDHRFLPPPPQHFMGNRGPGFFPPPPFPRYPANQRLNTRFSPGSNGVGGDRNAGLMTERDKQRLRNIQMLQLQNDHPYTTDFYFQMKKYKADGNVTHLKKVFPTASDRQPRNAYQPTRFENALGKLQAVSALAPKRVIDTYLQVPFTSVHERNSHARVLRGIEEVHRLYLDIKEYKYRRAGNTLDEEHDSDAEFLAYNRILEALDQYRDNFAGWMLRKKGRALLFELIREFVQYKRGQNAGYMILTNLLKCSTLVTMKRMEHDNNEFHYNLREYLKIIVKGNVAMVDLMLQGIHADLFKATFGISVVLLIMELAAGYVLLGEAPISWSTFNQPLELDLSDSPVLNIHRHHELTGFARFPSIIKCFLDCDLGEFGRPSGDFESRGEPLEGIMRISANPDVLQAMDRRNRVFKKLEDVRLPTLVVQTN